MNLHEGAEEQAFRARVRDWMATHLQGEFEALRGVQGPGAAGYDAALAKRWEQHLASAGWVGMGWSAGHSLGAGLQVQPLPLARQLIFHQEYVRGGGPGRLGHIGETLLAPTLIAHGTAAQCERFLPGIRWGTQYWAQGYSEPGAGSDLAAVSTWAKLDATGRWVIHGQKVWTSWAQEADWIFALVRTEATPTRPAGLTPARTEAASTRHAGLTLLLVPLRQPGITVRPIRQITGAAEFCEVFFDGAHTEGGLHLGPVGEGWRVAMALLRFERGASTLGQQAHFQHELDAVIRAARASGAAQDPVLRQRIASAALGLRMLYFNALRTLDGNNDGEADDGGAAARASLVSKYAWSNWHRDLGQLAMDVLGESAGIDNGDPLRQRLQMLWLASRADTIYAGTNEIQLNLMAERGLGLPR